MFSTKHASITKRTKQTKPKHKHPNKNKLMVRHHKEGFSQETLSVIFFVPSSPPLSSHAFRFHNPLQEELRVQAVQQLDVLLARSHPHTCQEKQRMPVQS